MRKVVLCGIPHHSNLGDHAIYIAEKNLIKKKFPNYEIQTLDEVFAEKCAKRIKKYVDDSDILCLQGGGNLGNQYMIQERGRRSIIENFPNNKIILFPQTMYFSDNEDGKIEFENTKKIYNGHQKLYLMAREEVTYKCMKKTFKNSKVYFTPDIVTTMNESNYIDEKKGVLFLVRNDVEKNIDDISLKEIADLFKNKNIDITYSDNDKGGIIHELEKHNKVYEMLDLFKKSKIVITDRLHGMIFSVITGTPCIVFGNYNYKIEKSAECFKNLYYISYIPTNKNFEYINSEIDRLLNLKKQKYDNSYSIKIFDEVFDDIIKN